MTYDEVIGVVNSNKKGSLMRLSIERPVKTYKSYDGRPITKTTEATVRLGIKYDNMKAVAEMRETGEIPKNNGGLPYGRWEIPQYVIENKGTYYLRCYVMPHTRIKTRYFIGGLEVSKEFALQYCLKSESNRGNNTGCMDIKFENIREISCIRRS